MSTSVQEHLYIHVYTPGGSCMGYTLNVIYECILTSKYNYHLRKAIPLREHFLTVNETVKHFVPSF